MGGSLRGATGHTALYTMPPNSNQSGSWANGPTFPPQAPNQTLEMAMPPDNRPSFARIMDLRMMLLFGRGRIRTEAELPKLFGAVGLRASRVLSLPPRPR
jgi:hypothetical protein